jgi:inorganic pyrophosphatase
MTSSVPPRDQGIPIATCAPAVVTVGLDIIERMHPWHDSYIDDAVIATAFPAVIEIPKGSTNKYELDKETGLLRLDRVLYSAVYYPADYGFIPRTYCDDGDPLDVLVLGQEPVYPLTIVEARAIGVMRMRDEKGVDDKIVAVSVRDPSYSDYTDKSQLPQHLLRQLRRFFEDYKVLEHKQVLVEDLMGPADAVTIIAEALEMYRRLRRGDLTKGVRV